MSSFFRKKKVEEETIAVRAENTHETKAVYIGRKVNANFGDGGQLLEKEGQRDVSRALYCMVLPTNENQSPFFKKDAELEPYRTKLVSALVDAGLDVTLFYSIQRDEIYLKVGATDARLLQMADQVDYQLELDPIAIETVAESEKDPNRRGLRLEAPFDRKTQKIQRKGLLGDWYDASDAEVTAYIRSLTHVSPWSYLHAKYSDDWEKYNKENFGVQIYKCYQDGTILKVSDRLALIQFIMEAAVTPNPLNQTKGAGLNLQRMALKKEVLGVFPLQTAAGSMDSGEATVDELYRKWSTFLKLPWSQPIDDIRLYFGEKVALYFAFLGHYTKWLAGSSILGCALFLHQLGEISKATGGTGSLLSASGLNNDTMEVVVYSDVPEIGVFAAFMALWASFLLEFWKRKQSAYAMMWGMSNYEKTEVIRPEFRFSVKFPNPVTGRAEPYYPTTYYQSKLATGFMIVGMMVVGVIAIISGIFVFKVFVTLPGKTGISQQNGTYLALAVNAIVINILGTIFKKVAKMLNDWENHRTDTAYEDALILKTFLFCFVNSYATLFYMAFIKSGTVIFDQIQMCEPIALSTTEPPTQLYRDACFGQLGASLLIIFLVQIFVNNTLEVVVPTITGALARRRNLKEKKDKSAEKPVDDKASLEKLSRMRSPAEDQFFKKSYEGTFDDFLELALQFGYVTLFVAAFPIAPFLAFLNNQLEIRVDSFKITQLCRRPVTQGAQDIGSWQTIFAVMGIIAVLTNSGVVFFTSHTIPPPSSLLISPQAFRVWMWVLSSAAILVLKFCVDKLMSDTPGWVRIQLAREEFIVRKCLYREPDEDDDEIDESAVKEANVAKYSILDNDPAIEKLAEEVCSLLLKHAGNNDVDAAFKAADKSGDGTLSTSEVKRILKRVGGIAAKLTDDEIDVVVDNIDINNSGDIDYNEFINFMKRHNKASV